MSNTKAIFIFMLIGMMIIPISYTPAFACSCTEPPPPAEAFEDADVVFSGKAVEIKKETSNQVSSASPMPVKFDVQRVWKGTAEKTITISTALSSASCGYEFEYGKTYLVYAYGDESLQTGLCTRTQLFADAYEDLRALGAGKTIQTETGNTPPESNAISVPSWVKKNAGWWAGGQIEDKEFVQGIQYLIQKGVMKIPETKSSDSKSPQQIPTWIKNNARWWSDGQISDSEFVSAIQYLINQGIMKVGTLPTSKDTCTGYYC